MTQKDSIDWFIGKAKSAAGYRRNLVSNVSRSTNDPIMGKMFFFYYDPKFKKTLPIYDRFPLVFPIESYSDGFLGLNLHYLNISNRQALLQQLSKYRSNARYDESTRLKLSYDLLKGASTMKFVGPCIKRYLYGHVRSSFIEIHADEWNKVIELPVEIFITK